MLPPNKIDLRLAALLQQMKLPDVDRGYISNQLDRGHTYYLQRIRQIGLSGDVVLDAGCGCGVWSIALCNYFNHVTAIEVHENRLSFLRAAAKDLELPIDCKSASIETLPFEDGTFDAVFCNGVLFITDPDKSLAEFSRVLRPGGKLYVSYNDHRWWDHLIEERGINDPVMVAMGCETFLNFTFRSIDHSPSNQPHSWIKRAFCQFAESQFDTFTGPSMLDRIRRRIPSKLYPPFGEAAFWHRRGQACFEQFYSEHADDTQAATLIRQQAINIFGELVAERSDLAHSIQQVERHGTKNQLRRLGLDLSSRLLRGQPCYVIDQESHSFSPELLIECLRDAGMSEVGTASEGTLILDPSRPAADPIYPPRLGIWETVARKPKSVDATVWRSPGQFFLFEKAARNLQRPPHDALIPSLRHERDMEATLSEQYRSLKVPKDALQSLVGAIVDSEYADGYEDFEAVYRFIQDALFHHPTLQLRGPKGWDLPDATAILLSGMGRCGHAAAVVCALYRALGYEARELQLHKHIAAEVLVDGVWRVLDPDLYKYGARAKLFDESWPDLDAFRAEPDALDRVPSIGVILSPDIPAAKTRLGEPIKGYVDTGLAWDRPCPSSLYFDRGGLAFPKPPTILANRNGDRLLLDILVKDPATRALAISVSSKSRGWHYRDGPTPEMLNPMPKEAVLAIDVQDDTRLELDIEGSTPILYVSVAALDDRMALDTRITRWPGDEIDLTA